MYQYVFNEEILCLICDHDKAANLSSNSAEKPTFYVQKRDDRTE